MGNYRQHVAFAGALGGLYALGAGMTSGLHWVYGSVAALLTTLGGLLPDLDHPVGVELKGFTGILGVLTAVAVWHRVGRNIPDLPFEIHLWMVVLSYGFVRHVMRRVLARSMVHRGISHSFPTCAVWGALTFMYYPGHNTLIRVLMAVAVMLGFLSHLVLDEMFSVDLSGRRVKRSFGTAMKFWAPSLSATIAMYALLSFLSYRIIKDWPDESLRDVLADKAPPMIVPWGEIKAATEDAKQRIDRSVPQPPQRYGPSSGRVPARGRGVDERDEAEISAELVHSKSASSV